jgi:hypothetical protein
VTAFDLSAFLGFGLPIALITSLPFFASFALDGLLHLGRRRGPKLLLLSVGSSIVIGLAAYVAWKYFVTAALPNVGGAAFIESMREVIRMLLPYAIGLALLGFVARTVRNGLSGKAAR